MAAACVNIFLARSLSLQEYGEYGIVMTFLVWIESAANPGISAAVQKKIAQYKNSTKTIIKKTVFLQLGYSSIILLISFFFAPLIAKLLHDDKLTLLLRVASLDVIFCGIFTVYYSALTGLLHFKRSAFCTVLYSTAKLIFIVILVMNGFSVIGALVGNILASISGILVSWAILGFIALEEKKNLSCNLLCELIYYAAPITLFALLMNLLLSLDVFMVKRILWKKTQDVGCYVLASTLSKSFYILMISLPTVLFPTLMQAISSGEERMIAHHLKQAEGILVFFLISTTLFLAFFSSTLIKLLFSEKYLSASQPLRILVIGMGVMSGFSLLSTVLQARGALKTLLIFASSSLVAAFFLNQILISKWQTMGAAWSVLSISLLITIFMKIIVRRKTVIS